MKSEYAKVAHFVNPVRQSGQAVALKFQLTARLGSRGGEAGELDFLTGKFRPQTVTQATFGNRNKFQFKTLN